MKNSLLKNLFSSGIQAIAIQIFGAAFFYLISLYLAKESFGLINWANALSMLITTLLSCGMEQVIIRRIAASQRSDWAAAAYLLHALVGSIIAFIILFALSILNNNNALHYLPWFFAAQAIMYIGTPLKQFLNAKQRFTPYGIIALTSNVLKIILVSFMIFKKDLSITSVVVILTICASFEFVALLIYILKTTDFSFVFRFKAYTKLIRESLPQYFSVIFDGSLSRMDWILLGLLSSNVATADYSFAYKAYEIARLPVLIIAPVILTRFARMFTIGGKLETDKQAHINQLFTVELFIAMLIPLCLNIIWSPWVSVLTGNKYGASNKWQFLILSICIPFQFIINLLWTLTFSNKKYRAILKITVVAAVGNVLLNLALIPIYKGTGAAIAFLASTLFQAILYYIVVRKSIMHFSLRAFIVFTVIACGVYFISIHATSVVAFQLIIALGLYIALSFLLKQITTSHFRTITLYLKR